MIIEMSTQRPRGRSDSADALASAISLHLRVAQISQAEFARRAKLSTATVSRMIRGQPVSRLTRNKAWTAIGGIDDEEELRLLKREDPEYYARLIDESRRHREQRRAKSRET